MADDIYSNRSDGVSHISVMILGEPRNTILVKAILRRIY
jgi:hypothetical protein